MSNERVRRAIKMLFQPGDVVEVRVPEGGRYRTISGYFNDVDKMCAAIEDVDGLYPGIYYTFNPVNPALLGRANNRMKEYAKNTTSDKDVVTRRWMVMDFDPVRPAGISASDAEKAASKAKALLTRDALTERGWPMPITADSGNGWHLLYKIDLANEENSTKIVQKCLQALGAMFSDDAVKVDESVFNAAQLIKTYGTIAAKGDTLDDRPHRRGGFTKTQPDPVMQVSREQLEALAAEAPVAKPKKTSKGGTKVTPERMEEFFDYYELAHDGRKDKDGGWIWIMNPCPLNSDHTGTSSAIILKEDGMMCFECKHNGCQMAWSEFRTKLEDMNDDKEPFRFVTREEGAFKASANFPVEMLSEEEEIETGTTKTEDENNAAVDAEADEDGEAKFISSCKDVRQYVDDVMRLNSKPTRDDPGTPEREKARMVCIRVFKHLMQNGKLFNCGNVATYLDSRSREMVQVVKGDVKFHRLLMRYGINPSDPLCNALGQYLGARAVTDAPPATVYNLSFYDSDKHLLYLNEYGGNFLRINGDMEVTRHRNGDADLLFADGTGEQKCDPLVADLEYICTGTLQRGSILPETRGGLIQEHILDTIRYDEGRMGRENAHMILMVSILGLYLYERISSYPYVFLYGAGAAMKSSLCKAVGRLVQGEAFRVVAAESDPQKLKDLAISMPFLVLDEANHVRKLSDLLKAIGTGAMDSRRELYTTATMRHTPYQARIWMTANTADINNETVSARMLIVDAASRTEAEPYRSEHYIKWTEGTRNKVWTELVGRLITAMCALRRADEKGHGDMSVDHRMSGFFVMGRAIAKQEGYEERWLAAMASVKRRQEGASLEGNEIVDLIRALPKSYANTPRKASEWSSIFLPMVDEKRRELQNKVARTGWVAWQFAQNFATLTKMFGMDKSDDKHNNVQMYSFTKLPGNGKWGDHCIDVD